ncbi:aldehyde dehydrogenase family protein [Hahella sp. KA22]|uniref:coniferyl aldehyde dehydrogenase n=1 Tax=Hahella sp. KA22 TaxID=1628392 RepID=UPI000FDDA677|nr:coniferyl aldehyde dehydrogenase [Hahella sp. KA22]AZZ90435.1 coniferyl aldehyde dehydrogenase [Hahella sp. KA22]QAY53805.1 aldehyde dehydrogenase family protein [Hahella sp. KA22]
MAADVLTITTSKKEIQHLHRAFQAQKRAFDHAPNPSYEVRRDTLIRLKKALLNNQEALLDAINEDFSSRSRDETLLAEFMPAIQGINYTLKHLKSWMKPSRRQVGLLFFGSENSVHYQALGVVGIIVPWNYPLNLAVGPLITALAAGNRAMIKMSEYTPRTSQVFQDLMANTFSEDLVSVIVGEADVAAEFSRQPFDHLIFTGSTAVGRMVMRAAAENLTPVTLELGGKSPAVISKNIPITDAAERIAFGKAFNAGQTCIAPDYVLCPEDKIEPFIDAFREKFRKLYASLKDNPDYTAIINDRQLKRLNGYLKDAQDKGATLIEMNPANEDFSRGARKLPLTLIINATPEMKVLQEEIFGPLLPIVPYHSIDDAIRYINNRPRPLALYYFGYKKSEQKHLLERTHAGGVCINDTLVHFAQDDLPFGGIGESGMGHYHGKEGFLNFSNHKAVHTKQRFHSGKIIFPPHGTLLHQLVYKLFLR